MPALWSEHRGQPQGIDPTPNKRATTGGSRSITSFFVSYFRPVRPFSPRPKDLSSNHNSCRSTPAPSKGHGHDMVAFLPCAENHYHHKPRGLGHLSLGVCCKRSCRAEYWSQPLRLMAEDQTERAGAKPYPDRGLLSPRESRADEFSQVWQGFQEIRSRDRPKERGR